jgi:macrolide phosphotransferase
MLAALASDIAEHGGQPISVEPLPSAATAAVTGAAAVPLSGAQDAVAGAGPGMRAADGGAPAPVPPVTVLPVPAVQPAVHVTPIPADPPPAPAPAPAGGEGGAGSGTGEGTKTNSPDVPGGPDDTSTAALTIVDVHKN